MLLCGRLLAGQRYLGEMANHSSDVTEVVGRVAEWIVLLLRVPKTKKEQEEQEEQ